MSENNQSHSLKTFFEWYAELHPNPCKEERSYIPYDQIGSMDLGPGVSKVLELVNRYSQYVADEVSDRFSKLDLSGGLND